METVRIRDPEWKKVGSRINIPDPPHCKQQDTRMPKEAVLQGNQLFIIKVR
jgi:hypothetical protein